MDRFAFARDRLVWRDDRFHHFAGHPLHVARRPLWRNSALAARPGLFYRGGSACRFCIRSAVPLAAGAHSLQRALLADARLAQTRRGQMVSPAHLPRLRRLRFPSCAFGAVGFFGVPVEIETAYREFAPNRQAALALMIMSVVLAPVVEETVFRGYIYPVVARTFGVAVGIIGTGTVFGLLHAEQLWGGWAQIALLVAVGIVFTWVRAAKRTVFASYLLHVSYNSLLFIAFLVSNSGFRSLVHH